MDRDEEVVKIKGGEGEESTADPNRQFMVFAGHLPYLFSFQSYS
jgi:hypothetical protein